MDDNFIKGFKSKIEQIIAMYESEKLLNAQLSEELSKNKKQLVNSNNRITELEKQIDNLQLTEAFKNSSKDEKEAKQKVAKLIKEIDKCIGLLNE
ncbi:MAG: hypothetical protein M0R23_02670 [Bacteroidales bacterium]|nr:hypothetical protein [Bacteroidales bacterium]